MDTKTIVAVAVGPQKDKLIKSKNDLRDVRPYIMGLVDGLAKRSRELGKDYVIEYRERDHKGLKKGKAAKLAFAAGAGGEQHLVFAMSTTALQGAKDAGNLTPIVFPSISNLKGDKIARGNSTGVSARRSQTAGACFERFVEAVSSLKEVRALYKPGYPPAERALKLVTAAAKKRGVKITPASVRTREELEKKLEALPKRRKEDPATLGVLVLPVDICLGAARKIIDVAQREKLIPTFFPITDCVSEDANSALGGYGVAQRKCGELAADHVYKILWEDAEARKLPITEVGDDLLKCVVSRSAASALGIKI